MSDGAETTEYRGVRNPPGPGRGQRALDWWRSITAGEGADPAAIAQLRRARDHVDVLQIRPAVSLARRLGGASTKADDRYTRATLDLARVLAHVREHEVVHPMRAMGWKRFAGDRRESNAGDDRPRLSEARFRRLLQVDEGEERVVAFTRLIAFMEQRANVEVLAQDFLDWNHPERGDRVRERWAFNYYAAASAAPTDDISATRDESK